MMKLAYGPKVVRYMERTGVETVHVKNGVDETIISVARALRKRIQDVVVLVMDRPRHQRLIEEIRATGAALRMFTDGDIAAAIAPSIFDSGADLYMGVGGAPEAVLAAAALKCLGGDLQAVMWPRDEEEKKSIIDAGYGDDLGKVFYANDLANGQNIIFCATGISDSPLLKGVQVRNHTATTHSVLMRAKSKTVRQITTHHDLRSKTIYLRSDNREHRL
jgi:fructose-1,6-bisphosphatase II